MNLLYTPATPQSLLPFLLSFLLEGNEDRRGVAVCDVAASIQFPVFWTVLGTILRRGCITLNRANESHLSNPSQSTHDLDHTDFNQIDLDHRNTRNVMGWRLFPIQLNPSNFQNNSQNNSQNYSNKNNKPLDASIGYQVINPLGGYSGQDEETLTPHQTSGRYRYNPTVPQ